MPNPTCPNPADYIIIRHPGEPEYWFPRDTDKRRAALEGFVRGFDKLYAEGQQRRLLERAQVQP